MSLYLHDMRVEFVTLSSLGTIVKDTYGERHCVFATGKEAKRCLSEKRQAPLPGPCPNCSWEPRVYKCQGSCEMKFRKEGCE